MDQQPGRGVALPSWRQVRRVSRMNAAERAALHGSYPHRDLNCPVEAALTATQYRVETIVYAGGIAFVWLCTALVWLIAPNDHVSLRGGSYDPVAWQAAALGSLALTLFFLYRAMSAASNRQGAAACAASGPTFDPWRAHGL